MVHWIMIHVGLLIYNSNLYICALSFLLLTPYLKKWVISSLMLYGSEPFTLEIQRNPAIFSSQLELQLRGHLSCDSQDGRGKVAKESNDSPRRPIGNDWKDSAIGADVF